MKNSGTKPYTFKFAIDSNVLDYIVNFWEKQNELKGLKYQKKTQYFGKNPEYEFKALTSEKTAELINLRLFIDNEIKRADELIRDVKKYNTLKGLLLHFFPDYKHITNFNIYHKANLYYYLIIINKRFTKLIERFNDNLCYYSGDESKVLSLICDAPVKIHELPEEKILKAIVNFLAKADDEH